MTRSLAVQHSKGQAPRTQAPVLRVGLLALLVHQKQVTWPASPTAWQCWEVQNCWNELRSTLPGNSLSVGWLDQMPHHMHANSHAQGRCQQIAGPTFGTPGVSWTYIFLTASQTSVTWFSPQYMLVCMSDQGACLTPSPWICDLRSCGYCVAQHPSSSSCSENLTAHSTSEVAHLASHDAKVGPLLSVGERNHLHGRQHLPCHNIPPGV